MNSQAEDKLLRMLAEGKITPEQFKELRATAEKAEKELSAHTQGLNGLIDSIDRVVPPAVRIQIAGWMTIIYSVFRTINIMFVVHGIFTPLIIVSVIMVVLGVGLINRKRWAYVYEMILLGLTSLIMLFTYAVQIHFGFVDFFFWLLVALMLSLHREFNLDISRIRKPTPSNVWASIKRAWAQAPRCVQYLLLYLVVIAPVLNIVAGFVFKRTMIEMARQQGKTLHEMRIFIFNGLYSDEALSAIFVCLGLALGILYRQKWAWAIGVALCIASIGYTVSRMGHDLKESFIYGISSALTGDVVSIGIDAALLALFALAFRWYFPKRETEQIAPDGEPVG